MTDITNIRERAESVKNATQVGENTAERVGSVLVDVADTLSAQAAEVAKKTNRTDLPSDIVSGMGSVAAADKVTVNVDKYHRDPSTGVYGTDDEDMIIDHATETEAGVMSAADKKLINSLPQEVVTDMEADADADKVTVNVSKFAKVDGSYTAQGVEVDIPSATETEAGVMSAADKKKLEGCTESVSIVQLDGLVDSGKLLAVKAGKPVTYAVTQSGRNVGMLVMYGDSMGHGVTQILQTLNKWNGKDFGTHQDGTWHQYARYFNHNSPYLEQDKDTWSEWKPYLDNDVEKEIAAMSSTQERMKKSLGVYSDRPDIVLTAKQTNVAISKDGVKVAKQGWAIAEFTAELGNEYLFKPGVTDGEVCVFAEYIDKVETRAIDYQTTYDESGRVKTATATYNGKTYTYTYDYSGTTTVITDQDGQKVQELPGVYTTTVGSYSVLTRLNEGAELPEDGYCRFVSNFQAAAAIKVVVSYKVGSADLTMKVVRDGMVASMCTQLSKINKKVDDVAQSVPKMWINVCSTKDTALMVDGKRVEIPAKRTTILYPKRGVWFIGGVPNPECIKRFDIHSIGSYQVSLPASSNLNYSDTIGLWGLGNISSLDVSGWDTSKVTSFYCMFAQYKALSSLDVSGWDTSKVTSFYCMFYNCASLTTLDVSGWDVSNATILQAMFSYCNVKSLDLSNWNLINCKNLDGTFEFCNKLTTIKGNNLCQGQVVTIRAICNNCNSLTTLDVSGWDTSNVQNMYSAFQNCGSLTTLDVSGWDTSSVTATHNMFYGCSLLQELDLSGWNLSKVRFISYIFKNCRSLATLTFGEGFGKMNDECKTLDLSDLQAWKNDSVKSLLTLYDRKANGMGVITIKLHANAKAVLGEEGIAELTAKGYTIA